MTQYVLDMIALAAGAVFGFWVAKRAYRAVSAPAPLPQATPQQRHMMGLDTALDQKVPVQVRDWNAMKLALWRSKVAWGIVTRAAEELVERAAHMEGCAAKSTETEPCLPDCPDRELRMSALVILGAARQFTAIDARQPANAPYYAPSRERYSEILAELAVARVELEALRGKQTTAPAADSPQLQEAT